MNRRDTYFEPDCRIWGFQGSRTTTQLAHKEAWIGEELGAALLTFMAQQELREAAEDLLREMVDDCDGEIYTFAACAHGAVLVAHDAQSVAYRYGNASVVGIISRHFESNHDRLSGQSNLIECARAILRHDLQNQSDIPNILLEAL